MAMPAEQRERSEKTYQDVSPLNSDSESDLDNDPAVRTARDSTEVANHDREILDEEEERENLLTSNGNSKAKPSRGFFGRSRDDGAPSEKRDGRQIRRDKRRKMGGKGDTKDGDGALMFEMEEGGLRSDVSSQASSSSLELDKLNLQKRPTTRVSSRITGL